MTRELKLTQGYVALVDDEDYAAVSRYRWFAMVTRPRSGEGVVVYAYRSCPKDASGVRRSVLLHRQVLGLSLYDGCIVDHADGDGLNNSRSNLRLASATQNARNMRPRKTRRGSGFKGVCRCSGCATWRARIVLDGKEVHLGTFSSEVVAAGAYDLAAMQHFGLFARTNFQEEYNAL